MRRRISMRGCVRPFVRWSVRRSVGPSVPSYFQTRTRRVLCRVSGLVCLLNVQYHDKWSVFSGKRIAPIVPLTVVEWFPWLLQVAIKREDAVTKEMMRKLADDKKMAKKEKVWKAKNVMAKMEMREHSGPDQPRTQT